MQEHEAHNELPNWLTLLYQNFPNFRLIQFLHSWENIFFSLLIASIFIGIFWVAAKRETFLVSNVRNLVETIVESFENFVVSITGERGRKYVPFIGTLFIYILLMNWSGLIPFSKSPTSSWSVTAGLAIVSTTYIHYLSIRELGLGGYIRHLAGNLNGVLFWTIGLFFIFPLMFVLDAFVLPFSLSLRLFANISSEDALLFNFAQLVTTSPVFILLQILANLLAILFSTIQALVFTLLTTIYLSLFTLHHEEEPRVN